MRISYLSVCLSVCLSVPLSCLVHNYLKKEHLMFILSRKVSCGLRISHDPDLRSLDLHWTNEGHQLIIINMVYQKRACGGCVERIVLAKALSTSNKLIDHPFQSCFIKRGFLAGSNLYCDRSKPANRVSLISLMCQVLTAFV